MGSRGTFLRAIALLSVGAVAIHQLRFVVAYGGNAGEVLAFEGHSYLPLAGALIAVVVVAACLGFARSLVSAAKGGHIEPNGPPFGRLWACASVALLSVYTLQEGFEGHVFAGHPSGLVGVFGNGGWTAIPLALAVGALIALLLEGARRAIVLLGARGGRARLPRPRRARWRRLPVGFPKLDVVSQHLAARAPPFSS